MHTHTIDEWKHSHDFVLDNQQGERMAFYVLGLTAVTMVIEIVAGMAYGSMALLADGWHMGTHVAAFLITIFAYRYARAHANNPDYAFGTGKVGVLGGFASAVALAVVALVMLLESVQRFFTPHAIQFDEAIMVAVIGLLVNVVSVFLLKDDHHHHGHDHGHDHHHHGGHHHDHNLKAAYMHVMADAFTSLLAIVALLSGKYYGWDWMDPVMGIVGAIIITKWAYGLLQESSPILLDGSIDREYLESIEQTIEADADNRLSDIHIWRVGAHHYAAIITIVTHYPQSVEHYKSLLQSFDKLSHVTVEVIQCNSEPCIPA
ncbi:MAG: CDF family Co(II)/Ni(II) efflux transporter DmeF [Gammaproteobacteria bacterium]|jgi:cation diffusion facilitator family transporter|nr:CDF family Co(II)/Ni(II) efflux transporter DmeF [Gammaproteobacteria bacterium]MBT4605712.1 CDF family Co(II)/Ni(II) efflux transporter DmeF [Thiotrichales bacterium]MBT3966128.1 CDF family Co(II)/Ni(II) efflux transporter DmeF [Gammaproteobacteria bacterium]MBT4081533.1 CDF family Co(II)/Ni(II) efflux transporter DmeF [Gammaproteobacteria bacterium]MBT4331409.1 CDF family Co(II)/Ni(II) efflux transporter DmeF [Gammaproteobacteria bacterium]